MVTPSETLEDVSSSSRHEVAGARSAAREPVADATDAVNDQVALASPQDATAHLRRTAVASALRTAIDRNELCLHYQPQVDLQSGAIYGVEALLRWQSSTLGAVPPSELIAVAELTDQIAAIGSWVLHAACAQAAAWRRAGLAGLRVCVNISSKELVRGDLAQQIQSVLLETGAEPGMLGIEVTETTLVGDTLRAARTLHALRAIGVQIALDDFGTGYSNLSMLRSLPIDVIKIDRSYVHDVTAAPAQVSITRAVINMAHSLQMKVLAEGVETEGQLALLIANRCDAIQGYFFSQAVPAAEIETLWRERRHLPEKYFNQPPRQRTLLLVDDEENIVASLKRSLRRGGYRIVTANSAAEGLQRLAESEVDVIVSDQRMPVMTGVEFLRRAKALYPETVRIVLSGYTELQSITDAINEGAIYKFLTKPWEDDLLRANIEEAFRQKEMADENRRLDREVRVANQELAALNECLQSALAAQHERLNMVESRTTGALEILLNVPVPILGVDDEGMIAFANRDADDLLREFGPLVGRDADDVLPQALRPVLHGCDGTSATFSLNGQPCRGVCRAMSAATGVSGRLVVLIPHAPAEEPR